MVSAHFLTLLLATAANAVPFWSEGGLNSTGSHLTTRSVNATARSLNATARSVNAVKRGLNATKRNSDRRLAPGEVLVFGQDSAEIIQLDKWHELVKAKGYLHEPPAWNQSWIDDANHLAPVPYDESIHGSGPAKRDCAHTFSIVKDKEERFVNWDVQMSPVVIGHGKGIDVTVSKSFSVADAVTVSAGLDLTAVKDRIGGTLGIDVSRTWTTQQGYMIRGTVEDGETGTVISTPWTNRYYGRAFQGCVGSMKQTGTWIADSYEEGSYEGVDWVAGAITVCAKKQKSIPLSRCNGSGDFK
ncbi:hypothetical protein CTA2_13118 [Colletotrichum tanaceti]|uniref:Uncharacterized protein n=1 Tax=Colletotrichum tanaceti TaxID=1306861 RepID=A0A4U6XHA8_9PEZI|nr:hypothetical protein CTA2_13118 [Colletotrichum tanaceti]TKW55308.1 hypothetical protein CTA1_12786 [Colletotrichum tanaceti]